VFFARLILDKVWLALEKGIQNNKASILHTDMCVKICPSSRRDRRGCACAPTPTRSSSTRVRCQTPNGGKKDGSRLEVLNVAMATRTVISGAPGVEAFHSHNSVYGNATGPASRHRSSSCEALLPRHRSHGARANEISSCLPFRTA